MSNMLKLSDISLTKLNNAEFTYFAGQITAQIETHTAVALHVDETLFTAFKGNHGKLVELVDQSRTADETAQIAETDKQEDDLLSYIFAALKSGRSHPIASKREAAQSLFNAVGTYTGVQSLPQRQQVQKVDGLILDLEKEANAAHIATLGLTAEVSELKTLNATYAGLLASRAESQKANPVESAKPIRREMYGQYDEIVSTAWAFSIASPSEPLTAFITSVNKLIADTNAAYNQRMAQRKKEDEGGNE